MPVSDVACAGCRLPNRLLCEQADRPLSWFQSRIRPRRFPPGHVLFHEGDLSQTVFCVKSGMVKLYRFGSRGEPHILRLLGSGHLIGFRAALVNERFAATAEVVKEAEVCSIPKLIFMELLETSRAASLKLLQHLANELRISEDQLIAQAQETVLERTIRLLAQFLDESASELTKDVPIHLPLQRSEMAQMIGTTPETLSRVLHRLAREELLTLTRREIHVRDAAALRARAAALPGGPA